MLSLGLFTESEAKHPAADPFFVILNEVKDLGREFYWRNADGFFFAGQILRLRLRMTRETLRMTGETFSEMIILRYMCDEALCSE